MNSIFQSRRNFLKNVLLGAVTLPIIGSLTTQNVEAQTVPAKALEPSDPMAANFGYVADATKADKAKFPKYTAGQQCKNCTLYLEGGKTVEGATGEFGRCGLFTNGLVSAAGWCNSYVVKIA